MYFINLTPHAINILGDEKICVPPSGGVARCLSVSTPVGVVESNGVKIPVVETSYGEVTGLPKVDLHPGAIYIVSGLVLAALKAAGIRRRDVVAPGDQVRDIEGLVVGCRNLTC